MILILSNIISNNIYNNHFNNDIIVQVDNGNTKTKQIQRTRNVRRSQIIQTKIEEISSPSPFSYFSGTCVSKRFYSNLISKSRSHLIFTVTLSFYVLFLGLIFRNYLLAPKLNHGFSGKNTSFLKINYNISIMQNIYSFIN